METQAHTERQEPARRPKETAGTACYTLMESPLGRLLLGGDGRALTLINFQAGRGAMAPHAEWREEAASFAEAVRQLTAYFAGELTAFDLPLAPRGTPFQQKVWRALRDIPYGRTRSYGELADGLGLKNGARAVGAANGRNPLPVIVPCHRVIGSDGSLTGFYGGLELKEALLALEQGHSPGGQLALF